MHRYRIPAKIKELWIPSLLGLVTIGLSLGHLLVPDVVPAFRDLPFFHLPLRTAFANTSGGFLPVWNSGIHGGQPILSNPNYAAFYPPTWLAVLVTPSRAIAWLLILHGFLAYAGAWRLLGRLGAGVSSQALGAVAYFAGGAILASTNTLNLYCAMALFPWIISTGISALEKSRGWHRDAACTSLGIGLQLLAGAPEAVLISAITMFALAIESPRGRWKKLFAMASLAVLVSSVQLLPTLDRITNSARASGLDTEEALAWSFPPPRVIELAYPRFFGDATRVLDDLFFGWDIHDQNYPYVVSIYPGLLILCLGTATLLAFPVPYRRAWTIAAGIGFLLALGRHNPVYRIALDFFPWLGVIRYPEKFVLLPISCLAIAGALGWHHALQSRSGSQRFSNRSRLSFAVALMILGGGALLSALLHLEPQWVAHLIESHRGMPTSVPLQSKGLIFLKNQASISISIAASTALLLWLLRRTQISSRVLGTMALLLLTGDLLYFSRATTPVVGASEILLRPTELGDLGQEGDRVFAASFLAGNDAIRLRRKEASSVPLRSHLERFTPYVANLWGFQYVVHADFDRMATRWARHTESTYVSLAEDRQLAERFLGAWDVALLIDPRSIESLLRDRLDGREPKAASSRLNSFRKDRIRLPLRAQIHGNVDEAVAAARQSRFAVEKEEHLIGDRELPAITLPPGKILGSKVNDGHIDVRYRSDAESFIVIAVTFDEGWQGTVGEREVQLYPTALGQIAAAIPAGEQTLELHFRQRGLLAGGALSLLGLTVVGLAFRRERAATSGRMPL